MGRRLTKTVFTKGIGKSRISRWQDKKHGQGHLQQYNGIDYQGNWLLYFILGSMEKNKDMEYSFSIMENNIKVS